MFARGGERAYSTCVQLSCGDLSVGLKRPPYGGTSTTDGASAALSCSHAQPAWRGDTSAERNGRGPEHKADLATDGIHARRRVTMGEACSGPCEREGAVYLC